MTGPVILYDSRLNDATPVASSTAAGFDVLNLRDLRDYTFWKPSTLPATITVDRAASSYLSLPGTAGNYASTPSSAANSITGDIDIRFKIAPNDWTPATSGVVFSKWRGQKSWLVFLNFNSTFTLYISTDGVNELSLGSAVYPGVVDGQPLWVRITRVLSTAVVTFYRSLDGITWTQVSTGTLGGAGAPIFDSAELVEIATDSQGQYFSGKCYYAELRNGIDGPVVAAFDPTRAKTGDTSFTAATGEVWTINQSGTPKAELISPFVDYWALYGHDLFSRGCTVELRKSTDNFVADDVLVDTVTPTDDKPILRLVSTPNARYWRLRVLNGGAPTLAIALLGNRLEIPSTSGIREGFDPIGRAIKSQTNRSVQGRTLGRVINWREWRENLTFELVSWTWVRDTWRAAAEAWLESEPFLFCWNPDAYPKETWHVSMDESGWSTPHRAGSLTDLQVAVTGVMPV